MLSRSPIQTSVLILSTIHKLCPFMKESYKEKYLNDIDFQDIYLNLIQNSRCDDEIDYFMKEGLLYNGNTFYVPQGERV